MNLHDFSKGFLHYFVVYWNGADKKEQNITMFQKNIKLMYFDKYDTKLFKTLHKW